MSTAEATRALDLVAAGATIAAGTLLGCASLLDWAVTAKRRRPLLLAGAGVALCCRGLARL